VQAQVVVALPGGVEAGSWQDGGAAAP